MSIFGDLFGEEAEASSVGASHRTTSGSIPHPPRPSNGLCGIYNQGATCYMNSLLQTLLYTPEFRGICRKTCWYTQGMFSCHIDRTAHAFRWEQWITNLVKWNFPDSFSRFPVSPWSRCSRKTRRCEQASSKGIFSQASGQLCHKSGSWLPCWILSLEHRQAAFIPVVFRFGD